MDCKSWPAPAWVLLVALLSALACSSDREREGGEDGDKPGEQRDGGSSFDNPDLETDNPMQGRGPRFDGGMGTFAGGGCGLHCFRSESGPGTDNPFDVDNNPGDGVGLDDEGALIIARENVMTEELIWIANTSEGTVSKVDTNTFTEVGRYAVPNIDWNINENGPSRTSVDSEGSVYVGARFGPSISKISAAGQDCPDTNGDGMITTSAAAGDVLPDGEDDCVIWSTDLAGDARGVAVQETPTLFEVEAVPDGDPIIHEFPGTRAVWVGGREPGTDRLHKLDAETGQVLFTLDPAPVRVYGLALDGRGNLWLASQNDPEFARIDTSRCVDASCAMETVCVTQCSETSCPDTCDDAVIEKIVVVDGDNARNVGYGVTVDCNQRVWLGGAHGGDGVKRYNPLARADARLSILRDIAGQGVDGIHGIAADAQGWVWGGARDMGVWRINADTLEYQQVAGTGGSEFNAKGMAVDRRGRVWAIPFRLDYAMVITPGPTIADATVEKPIDGFVEPYTYSDMTGEQRRLAANEPGSYRQLFSGCSKEDKPTEWGDLEWDIDAPDGTVVVFLGRTADTMAELDQAPWFNIAAAPGRKSPVEVDPFIRGAQQKPGRYLEIEVRLFTTSTGEDSMDRCSTTPALTPRVKQFGLSFECEPDLG